MSRRTTVIYKYVSTLGVYYCFFASMEVEGFHVRVPSFQDLLTMNLFATQYGELASRVDVVLWKHGFYNFVVLSNHGLLFQILLKKSDPDASSLDVDKLVASKKDRLDVILKEFMEANKQEKTSTTEEAISMPVKDQQPLAVSRPALNKPKLDEAALSLLRPVGSKPKRVEPPLTLLRPAGSKPKVNKPSLTLMRPMGSKPKVRAKLVQDSWPSKESLAAGTESSEVGSTSEDDNVDVTLRKPTVHQSEDDEPELKMKPDVNLKMRKDMDEDLSNISLLQKPEATQDIANALASVGSVSIAAGEDMKPDVNLKIRKDMDEDLSNISLLQKPEATQDAALASAGLASIAAGEDTNESEAGK